ncbi:MAG TPA: FG-GAP-like repeat-containing protein [Labilithrix sp.]|nr:FG-GAP-like repeat-containing protein [Labilithrix sp.]
MTASSVALASIVVPLSGCGDDAPSGSGGGDDAGGFNTTPVDAASPSACDVTGKACEDGGVCAGNVCCAASLACGDVCCPAGNTCSFQKCAVPGAECHDSIDCGEGEFCDYTFGTTTDGGTTGGDAACIGGSDRTGRCLPRPPDCAPGSAPSAGGPISCLERCEYRPPALTFVPKLKSAWGGQIVPPFATDVMMAPIVIELDDDDCDGKVTVRDIPEIVFSTFDNDNGYDNAGKLHATSIVNGTFVDKWVVPNAGNATVVNPTKQIAAGNFDGKPGNEIVACGMDGKLHAFKGSDGSLLWSSPVIVCFMPSIADLDGDGNVEVIVEGGILNGADGTLKHAFTPTLNGPFVVSDIDSNGKLDVVTSSRAYDASGVMFVDTGVAEQGYFPDTSDWKGPWAGIGDFDNDGKPEVVAVDNTNHEVLLWKYDAAQPEKFTIVRQPVDMNALFGTNTCPNDTWGYTHGGGPPTVADFNNDGVPDVGLAGGIGYVVFDGKKLVNPAVNGSDAILWSKVTTDCSSASTGSTVFDFDGDGKAEVVYSDEQRMRIYDGTTGTELASICNTTSTLVEFPVVADVDNDGQADIIVVSNAFRKSCDEIPPGGGDPVPTKQSGVRVFGPTNGSWVRTRRVWNEHTYHITNVGEDGTIPKSEPANWKQSGMNNFRQNKQTGSEFAAPNLVGNVTPLCSAPGVIVGVRNIGEASVPAGVLVGVYSGVPGSGTKLGTVTTTRPLFPAEVEPLEFLFPAGAEGTTSAYAIVDDGAPAHPTWTECRTDDNTSKAASPACSFAK